LSAKTARAFAPAGISSFFEICDTLEDGKPIEDPQRIGARGGGFVIEKGVTTEVSIASAKKSKIQVEINRQHKSKAETTRTVVKMLLQQADSTYDVKVKHQIEAPIGAGFGTSAAGALSTALALSKALDLNHTYNELGLIAHAAEIACKTGLGTVGPLMIGGCILTLEPGAPGIAVIDRIPLSQNHVIVAGSFGGIPTKRVLTSDEKRLAINKFGKRTLDRILKDPSLENFMICCMDFAEETGFMTDRLRRLAGLAEKAGAIGAAQNMVGEVIHAVTTSENVHNVVQAFKQVLSQDQITVTKLDFQGARLLG
jgi:pantoate kinase